MCVADKFRTCHDDQREAEIEEGGGAGQELSDVMASYSSTYTNMPIAMVYLDTWVLLEGILQLHYPLL